MKWYMYFIIIAVAAFGYLIVVDLRSKKALKEKKAAEKAARIKSGQKKKKRKKKK